MSNDMSEHTTGAAIPDDVMREAVEAVDEVLFGPMPDDLRNAEIRTALESALKILTPAIERALIERMIADVPAWNGCSPGAYAAHDGTFDDAPYVFDADDIADAIREYLPTEDEDAT